MERVLTGTYLKTEVRGLVYQAFLPKPLPPDPPLQINGALQESLDKAHLALGELNGLAGFQQDMLPPILYSFIRKEAVLSSQIEGSQSSLNDLLVYEAEEAPGIPVNPVAEVSGYVRALETGMKAIQNGEPITCDLILKIHGILMSAGRGTNHQAGALRTVQNWIGRTLPQTLGGPGAERFPGQELYGMDTLQTAAFIPPPPDQVAGCLRALERFLNDDPERTPPLIKAALAHVQFETIHPFVDGNGRVGRILIPLSLAKDRVLSHPLLYLSIFFLTHRRPYYENLQAVRQHGAFEAWLAFFSEAVTASVRSAVQTAKDLQTRMAQDKKAVLGLGKQSGSALRILEAFCCYPVLTAPKLGEMTQLNPATVNRLLEVMGKPETGLIQKIKGDKRYRVYAYGPYLAILNRDLQPLLEPPATA